MCETCFCDLSIHYALIMRASIAAAKRHAREHPQLISPAKRGFRLILLSNFYLMESCPTIYLREKLAARGSNALKQLITDAHWGELDYFVLDLPPGTSDIHLTLVQTLGITGSVIVTTPQDVALADARKGANMFTNDKVNVPVLGLIENMSWFTPAELPENKYYIFGKDGGKRLAEELNVPLLGQIPIVQSIREQGDAGRPVACDPESITGLAFKRLANMLAERTDERNQNFEKTKKVEIIK